MKFLKLVKIAEENPWMVGFCLCVLSLTYQAGKSYTKYVPQVEKVPALEFKIAEHEKQIAVMQSQIESLINANDKKYSKTSILIAELNSRIKYCNKMKDAVTLRANHYYSEFTECDSVQRAKF